MHTHLQKKITKTRNAKQSLKRLHFLNLRLKYYELRSWLSWFCQQIKVITKYNDILEKKLVYKKIMTKILILTLRISLKIKTCKSSQAIKEDLLLRRLKKFLIKKSKIYKKEISKFFKPKILMWLMKMRIYSVLIPLYMLNWLTLNLTNLNFKTTQFNLTNHNLKTNPNQLKLNRIPVNSLTFNLIILCTTKIFKIFQ